jgi:hypothetical protein
VIGGLIWAAGFVLLGYLAGGSYQRVADLAGQASLILLALSCEATSRRGGALFGPRRYCALGGEHGVVAGLAEYVVQLTAPHAHVAAVVQRVDQGVA